MPFISSLAASPSPALGGVASTGPAKVGFPSEPEAGTLTGSGAGVPMVRLGALLPPSQCAHDTLAMSPTRPADTTDRVMKRLSVRGVLSLAAVRIMAGASAREP